MYAQLFFLCKKCKGKENKKVKNVKKWRNALPTDTVIQSVERRCDKPIAWVRILARVIFFIVPLRSFFSATLAKRWKVHIRQGFA